MLDVILPTCISDIYRLKILIKSIKKFWHIQSTFYVIVPKKDYDAFKYSITDKRFKVIEENSLIPFINKIDAGGWYRQQAVKLSAWRLPATSNFLVLDADCFLRREVEEDELVKDGKAAVNLTEGSGSWREWYEESAKLLRTKIPALQIPVTPCMLNTHVCQSLEEKLKQLSNYHRPWVWLLQRHGWTEYTLYHCWAEHCGIWDEYHVNVDYPLNGECVWRAEDLYEFSARKLFETRDSPFSLIQSTVHLPDELIWPELKPFLACA